MQAPELTALTAEHRPPLAAPAQAAPSPSPQQPTPQAAAAAAAGGLNVAAPEGQPGAAAPGGAGPAGEGEPPPPHGLHHLTRHWLPEEVRGEVVLQRLGAADIRAAEQMIRWVGASLAACSCRARRIPWCQQQPHGLRSAPLRPTRPPTPPPKPTQTHTFTFTPAHLPGSVGLPRVAAGTWGSGSCGTLSSECMGLPPR